MANALIMSKMSADPAFTDKSLAWILKTMNNKSTSYKETVASLRNFPSFSPGSESKIQIKVAQTGSSMNPKKCPVLHRQLASVNDKISKLV